MYKNYIKPEELKKRYEDAIGTQKDAFYELEVCSVFKKEKKFGNQLKKLKNLGFTHYMIYGNKDMVELDEKKQ